MIEILNNIAGKWFAVEFAIAWQVIALIAIIAAVDFLIKKWAWPQLRYALWLLVLVKLILPPTLTSPASFTAEIPAMAQRVIRTEIIPPATTPQLTNTIAPPAPIQSAPLSTEPTPTDVTAPAVSTAQTALSQAAAAPAALSWQAYAMAAWLIGIAILSSWLILRLRNLRREHLKNPQFCGLSEKYQPLLISTAAKLKLRKIPQVILTDKVCCPAVFGLFKPILLMPAHKFSSLSRQDIEHIFLHELAHIKRGDLVIHAVYMLLQIAYWFNPLLWLIRKHLQNLRELCCDATVARILKEQTPQYRQTLLETARQLLAEPTDPGLGLLGLFENSNWLIERLKWLEKKTWKNRPLRIATISILISLMLSCVLPMARADRSKLIDARKKQFHMILWMAGVEKDVYEQLTKIATPIKTQSKNYAGYSIDSDKLIGLISENRDAGNIIFTSKSKILKPTSKHLSASSWTDTGILDHPVFVGYGIGAAIVYKLLPDGDNARLKLDPASIVSCMLNPGSDIGEMFAYEGDINVDDSLVFAAKMPEKGTSKPYHLVMYLGVLIDQKHAKMEDPINYLSAIANTPEENPEFKATLPNGVTVELVGVCKHPGEGKQWWQPDGEPLNYNIVTSDSSSYPSDDPGYKFVFRKNGDADFNIKGSKANIGFQVIEPKDLTGYRAHIKKRYEKTDIKIASPSGKWKTAVTSKGQGSVSGEIKGKTIVLAAAEQAGNDVTISSSDIVGYGDATRIIAVDSKGNELIGQIKTDTGVNNIRQRTIRFADLNLSNIAEFRFQTCPYEYYTFKNVSLKPNFKTDVQIEVGKAQSPQPSESAPVGDNPADAKTASEPDADKGPFIGTLPNGVTVELVGLGTAPWKTEQQWWKPDGTNLNQPELKFPYLFQWNNQPNGLQFTCTALCKFSNYTGKEISVPDVNFSKKELSRVWGTDFTTDGYEMTYIASVPFMGPVPDKTNINLAIASKEFVQAKRIGNNYTPKQHQQYWLEKTSDQIILHPLRIGQVGTPCVDLTCKQENKEIEFRVFAKLKNGETERWGGGGVGKDVLFFQSTPKSQNTTIEDVEDIIIEFRTYEWITFKNVSLKPNFKTDVQIEVEKAQSPQPSEPAPIGDNPAADKTAAEPNIQISGTNILPMGDYALEFDGINDYLEIQASKSLQLGRHFTIQMWIKPEFPDTSTPDKDRNLLVNGGYVLDNPDEKNRQARTYGFGLRLRPEDNSLIALDISVANDDGIYTRTNFLRYESGWRHLVVTSDSNGMPCIDTSEENYKPAPNSNIIIGRDFLIPTGNPFKGQIAELRIWNRALSKDEIAEYENMALSGSEPNLVGCWTFEQAQGHFAMDISPYKNTARLGSIYSADQSAPTWVKIRPAEKASSPQPSEAAPVGDNPAP